MRWVLAAALVGACYSPTTERACSVSCVENGPCPGDLVCGAGNLCRNPDGTCDPVPPGQDASNVIPDGAMCFGSGLVKPCILPPTAPVELAGPIDTESDDRCITWHQTGDTADDVCVIAGTSIDHVASTVVTGKRPLVLLSTGDITITGKLDVASRRTGNQIGAGANTVACGAFTPPGDDTVGGSGGGGGSFQTAGGIGGGAGGSSPGGIVGAILAAAVTRVRSGCPGHDGRNMTAQMPNPNAGGASGGAVYLIANNTITLTDNATIDASGQGGGGAPVSSGGGGGGSGGLIGFDAQMIVFGAAASAFANGGGGGEGANSGTPAAPGRESLSFNAAGLGGFTPSAGRGGNGGTLAAPPENGSATAMNNGAGGGGGSVGYIFIFRATAIPVDGFSPLPTTPQ